VPGFEDSAVARAGRRHAMAHLSGSVGDVEGSLESERRGFAEEALADTLGPDEMVFLLIRDAVALSWTGRSAEALEVGDEAIGVCLEHGEKWYLSVLYYLRGARLIELGRPQEALDVEREALRLARGGFNTYTVANALMAIARISSTSGDDTRAAVLGGALSQMWPSLGAPSIDGPRESEESAGPIAEARARDFLAGAAYDAAFERGRRMSVDDIVSFVLDEHHPAPAQQLPRREAVSPDLTRRESEIADLIARGLSNKDIAEKLVISQRTAEGHVTHLLHKLGFESRARVAAWVAERRAVGQ
jgi:DNA-binding CsgD family transcriptional regulator